MTSPADTERHARAGTLAAALLSEPVGLLETLGLLADDRATLLCEREAARNFITLHTRPCITRGK